MSEYQELVKNVIPSSIATVRAKFPFADAMTITSGNDTSWVVRQSDNPHSLAIAFGPTLAQAWSNAAVMVRFE